MSAREALPGWAMVDVDVDVDTNAEARANADKHADEHADAKAAHAFAAIHADAPPHAFAANLHTQAALLQAGRWTLPVTVNHGERGNAWVCSPLTTYCDYAAEESLRHLPAALAAPLALACRVVGLALHAARIDDAVALNNWLLSTNLYPPFDAARDAASLAQLVAEARTRWPRHALWLRSLNPVHDAGWLAALQALGFALIPSRQVYLFDDCLAPGRQPPDLRRDLRLLRRVQRAEGTTLRRVGPADITAADCPRIAALYAALYTDKYSRFNPQYNAAFLQRWHAAGLLEFHGFRDTAGAAGADGTGGPGELVAVVGLFRRAGTLTAPVVGYDTSRPKSQGLYRLLMATVFDEAMRTATPVNLSAGAAHFKRLRGGRPVIEYSAVLASHMPPATRAALGLLRRLAVGVGVPLMRRYRL